MSSYKLIQSPPRIEDRELVKNLLCGPGPADIWPSVAQEMTKPILSPMDDEYYNVLGDIRAGLKYIFQTKSDLVLAMSGAGHAGMEAVISNLVAPGQTLLIAARGIWDERATILAKRYGIKPVVIQKLFTTIFSLEDIEPHLKRHRPAALFITHGDSSTGTVQNLIGLGDLCHKYGSLLIVDAVVSLVGVPFLMDEWKVDAVYSSTQKAVSGPAGISPIALSPRAEKLLKNRKHEPPFYFDVVILAQQWNCYGNTRFYHHTMSPPLMWALRKCLQEISKETLEVTWARHEATTKRFHDRLKQLPVEFLIPKPEDRLTTVTTLILPQGIDYWQFAKRVYAKHHITIAVGLGPTAGKALRIGLMGINSTAQVADAVTDAIDDVLQEYNNTKLYNTNSRIHKTLLNLGSS